MLRTTGLLGLLVFAPAEVTGNAPSSGPQSVTPFMREMVGNWHVRSRMWPGLGLQAIDLPPAIARRKLIGEAYLQEEMESTADSGRAGFLRVAYFSFNSTNHQYEYFSLDSRLPAMMSYVTPGANRVRAGTVELLGTSFVAPEWGPRTTVPFIFRLEIGPVQEKGQIVRLFLTEQNAGSDEFLAFEYVYIRQR